MSITVHGTFEPNGAVFCDLPECVEYCAELIFTGEHAGMVALKITNADNPDCNDTFWGCYNFATGEWQVVIPDDCCREYTSDCPYCPSEQTPTVAIVTLSGIVGNDQICEKNVPGPCVRCNCHDIVTTGPPNGTFYLPFSFASTYCQWYYSNPSEIYFYKVDWEVYGDYPECRGSGNCIYGSGLVIFLNKSPDGHCFLGALIGTKIVFSADYNPTSGCLFKTGIPNEITMDSDCYCDPTASNCYGIKACFGGGIASVG